MFKERIPVRLISGGSETLNANLYETLNRLGYEDIQTYRTTDVLDGKISNSQQIFVFPLVKEVIAQKKIRLICEQVKENPVLGIIKRPNLNLRDEYIETCNDFLYWPCSDNEFSYRMQRLCDVFDPPEYFSCLQCQ